MATKLAPHADRVNITQPRPCCTAATQPACCSINPLLLQQKRQAGADLKAWEEQQRQKAKQELEQMEVEATNQAEVAAAEVGDWI